MLLSATRILRDSDITQEQMPYAWILIPEPSPPEVQIAIAWLQPPELAAILRIAKTLRTDRPAYAHIRCYISFWRKGVTIKFMFHMRKWKA